MNKQLNKMTILGHQSSVLIGLFLLASVGLAACSDDTADTGGDATSGWNVDSETQGDVDAGLGADSDAETDSQADADIDSDIDSQADSDGEGQDGVDSQDPAQLDAAPNPIGFDSVAVGEEASVSVSLSNTGEKTLIISKIMLNEEAGEASLDLNAEFFADGDGWGTQTTALEPGMTHTVTVRYHPVNQVLDRGSIVVESNDPQNPTYLIPLVTQFLAPKIFSPVTVSFPRVPGTGQDPGWRGAWKITQVQNTGESPLHVSDIRIEGANSRFDFSIPHPTAQEIAQGVSPDPANDNSNWPDSLAPGERFDVRVWFAPDSNNPDQDQLTLMSDDPINPEYSVYLIGNSDTPCIEVSAISEVNFGMSSVAQTSQKSVTITNCSPTFPLDLESIEITDDGGGVFAIQDGSLPAGLPDDEFVLSQGEQTNFVVTFDPTQATAYSGSVRITNNDPAQSVIDVPLTGEGTENACPTAVATATIQGDASSQATTDLDASPLDTIQFDASASSDSDGSVARYEWTLLSSPALSSTRIAAADSESPTMFIDVFGEYKVELKVYDDQNTTSCGESAIVTINSNSDDDIHIQLTWTGGASVGQKDVDLHYLHPNGTGWGSESNGWDCYYANKYPVWGAQNSSPSMDIDDIRGPGPESISHSNLEDLNYKVGVLYYSDHGNGPTYATVEIRNQGVLIFSDRDQLLSNNEFWQVATVHGGDLSATPIDVVTQDYP